jgi:hypothetical protein
VPRALWGFSCGVRLGEVGQSARPNRFASQDGWIFCVTAPSDQRSPPKCLTILAPGAKPDNMIVGRESRSGIAAVSGPGHALCLPGGRIAPSGLPENALDVAGRNTAAAPGFFPRLWGPGGRSAETHRVRKHRFPGVRWVRSGEAAGSLPGAEPRLPPLVARSNLGRAAGELDCAGEARDPTSTVVQSRAEPEVRIHFPPAESPLR